MPMLHISDADAQLNSITSEANLTIVIAFRLRFCDKQRRRSVAFKMWSEKKVFDQRRLSGRRHFVAALSIFANDKKF